MLTGFARHPDGTIETLNQTDVLEAASTRQAHALWIDLEQPTENEVRAVGQAFNLDAEAVEDCLHGEQRPRIDEFDECIFLVLYGALGPEDRSEFEPRKLAAFCGPNLLITVHGRPLRSITGVRDRCRRNAANLLARGVDFILYSIIDAMVDNHILVTEDYETRLEELEEISLDPDVDESVLVRSAELRRELLELRRLATTHRELLAPLAKGEYEHLSDALEQRFGHVEDHLLQTIELLDSLRERLNGVRDSYHTTLAGRTNAIMKTLTLFATLLLPLSMIAGVYGMNLPLWPPPDNPSSFWAVLALMLTITLALLTYFRRKRWL
jgi:magnesium transporter